jgi:hypothetical protein
LLLLRDKHDYATQNNRIIYNTKLNASRVLEASALTSSEFAGSASSELPRMDDPRLMKTSSLIYANNSEMVKDALTVSPNEMIDKNPVSVPSSLQSITGVTDNPPFPGVGQLSEPNPIYKSASM